MPSSLSKSIVIIDQPECVAVDDINVASLASAMRKILALEHMNDYCEIVLDFFYFHNLPAKSINPSTERFVGPNVHHDPSVLAVDGH